MTLVATAITTAYVYSSAVVFGLKGEVFFWELATLIDIMLLGHWLEMRSVMGAGRALEELARLMPPEAHRLMPDGSVKNVPLNELNIGDRVQYFRHSPCGRGPLPVGHTSHPLRWAPYLCL